MHVLTTGETGDLRPQLLWVTTSLLAVINYSTKCVMNACCIPSSIVSGTSLYGALFAVISCLCVSQLIRHSHLFIANTRLNRLYWLLTISTREHVPVLSVPLPLSQWVTRSMLSSSQIVVLCHALEMTRTTNKRGVKTLGKFFHSTLLQFIHLYK